MIDVLRNHITNRLGTDLDHLDEVLESFKHLHTKRNEQLLSTVKTGTKALSELSLQDW